MKAVTLPESGKPTTRLGFGCGGLMRTPSSRGRQRVLRAALDQGIRHFDVARMYGLGQAENELGKALTGVRDQVFVTTKFGIEVGARARLLAPVQSVARLAFRMLPRLRSEARKRVSAHGGPRYYDPESARRSLEDSLRALRTDHVDLFLLHEPSIDQLEGSRVLEFLVSAREKGLIGGWGVAGYPEQIAPICLDRPDLAPIIQVPNDLLGRQMENFRSHRGSGLITFSPWSSALDVIRDFLADHGKLCRDWSDQTNIDLSDPDRLASLMLVWCFESNPEGVVLFGTSRPERIDAAVGSCADPGLREPSKRLAELVAGRRLDINGSEQGLRVS